MIVNRFDVVAVEDFAVVIQEPGFWHSCHQPCALERQSVFGLVVICRNRQLPFGQDCRSLLIPPFHDDFQQFRRDRKRQI